MSKQIWLVQALDTIKKSMPKKKEKEKAVSGFSVDDAKKLEKDVSYSLCPKLSPYIPFLCVINKILVSMPVYDQELNLFTTVRIGILIVLEEKCTYNVRWPKSESGLLISNGCFCQ